MTGRRFWWVAIVAAVALGLAASELRAELDTDVHLGSGQGSAVAHGDGSYTIYDTGGGTGDMWTGGDSFQYLYDSKHRTGDFSATVRVLSQTDTVDGRWGKVGIRASADPTITNSAFAMVQMHTGNDSTEDDPRIAGRRVNLDTANMLEIGMVDGPPRGIVPQPGAEVLWLRLDRTGDDFSAYWARDDNGSPAAWSHPTTVSDIQLPPSVTLGFAYSAHNSMPEEPHGVTFDHWSVVPEPTSLTVMGVGLLALARRLRRRRTQGRADRRSASSATMDAPDNGPEAAS